MSLSELSSPEARVRSGSGTHHPSAGPLMCRRAVGRSGELPSSCQHPAPEEMGSSLEQEVSKPLEWPWFHAWHSWGAFPPC